MRVGIDASAFADRHGDGRFARNGVAALIALDPATECVLHADPETLEAVEPPPGATIPARRGCAAAPPPGCAPTPRARRSTCSAWPGRPASAGCGAFLFPSLIGYVPTLGVPTVVGGPRRDRRPQVGREVMPARRARAAWRVKLGDRGAARDAALHGQRGGAGRPRAAAGGRRPRGAGGGVHARRPRGDRRGPGAGRRRGRRARDRLRRRRLAPQAPGDPRRGDGARRRRDGRDDRRPRRRRARERPRPARRVRRRRHARGAAERRRRGGRHVPRRGLRPARRRGRGVRHPTGPDRPARPPGVARRRRPLLRPGRRRRGSPPTCASWSRWGRSGGGRRASGRAGGSPGSRGSGRPTPSATSSTKPPRRGDPEGVRPRAAASR